MKKLILILLLGYFFNPALGSKPRLKRDTEGLFLASIEEKLNKLGRGLLKINTSLDTKVDEIKTELRKEMQDVKSDMNELKSQILAQQNMLNDKLDSLQQLTSTMPTSIQTLTSGMVLQEEKMNLKLEKLDTKMAACINSIAHSGDKILEMLNNTGLLRGVENNVDSCTSILSTINMELKLETKKITETGENKDHGIPNPWGVQEVNETGLLKDVLNSVSEFKNQTLISTGSIVEKADRVVKELGNFMRKMVNAQLNNTLNSMIAFENTTDYSIAEIWPVLKTTHFPQSMVSDVFGKLAGILREEEWIVIQARGIPLKPGRTREIFQNRTWTEYGNGFGSYDADFWFGLDKMHDLAQAGFTELLIELEDWEGGKAIAKYTSFAVSGESENYRLTVSGYSGNAGDALTYNNGQQFSTGDRDNDQNPSTNCAILRSPWWHGACTLSQLNYDYQLGSNVNTDRGLIWYPWKSSWKYSMKKTEMKIRRPAPLPN